MKRKLVKHGPSSYIVSLPLKWIKKHNLNKGDEVDVDETADDVVISAVRKEKFEHAEFSVDQAKEMTGEIIFALYKRGVDEIRVTYSNQDDFKIVRDAVSLNTNDYEIVESRQNSCTIRSIAQLSNEFDAVLRRLFLVTLSLAEEGVKAIQESNLDALDNIMFLEKSNNKLTIFCLRYLNTSSVDNYDRLGPIYFVVELLEKIADQYKYLYQDQRKMTGPKPSKKVIECYATINGMLRVFYECFYKMDIAKIREIKKKRDALNDFLNSECKSFKSPTDICLAHHAVVLLEKVFSLIDPLLVMTSKY